MRFYSINFGMPSLDKVERDGVIMLILVEGGWLGFESICDFKRWTLEE